MLRITRRYVTTLICKSIPTFNLTLFATMSCLFMTSLTHACTDFRITAKDSTVVVTRSMEFALDLQSSVRTSNRDRQFQMTAPDGKPGLKWKAKYGYVFLDGLNVDIAIDGLNEKGLSYGALYLPTLAEYQSVPNGQDAAALPYLNVGDWVLSNFATVEEVKDAIKKVYVFKQNLPGHPDIVFPLHFSIHDAKGDSIVLEYIGGQLSVYDNQVGVLTNSPSYAWHTTNLVNYIHLSPMNPPAAVDNAVTFAATGQGYGMVGLPGDISPPSRFVKTATLVRTALPVNDAMSAINLGEHIINNVDIPLGLARENENGQATNELTQWVVFKDLTHKVLYYRTYNNMTLRAVTLDKIDFSANAKRLQIPIASQNNVVDVTNDLLAGKINGNV